MTENGRSLFRSEIDERSRRARLALERAGWPAADRGSVDFEGGSGLRFVWRCLAALVGSVRGSNSRSMFNPKG